MQALTPILPNLERFVRALVRRRGTTSETTEIARDILAEFVECYLEMTIIKSNIFYKITCMYDYCFLFLNTTTYITRIP